MPEHIKALIFILFIATFVFFYAKKAIGPMLFPKELTQWRNAWFAITALAFLSQNFWAFIILSTLFLLYIAKSNQNKFGLYFVLLFAIPTIGARIPNLLDINYVRVLSLTILLPFFISFKPRLGEPSFGKPSIEKVLFLYILLNTLLFFRGTTFTDAMRYGLYGLTDIFLPYYAASRAIKDFDQLKRVMIAFVLACMVAGAIGAYEFNKSWLLYSALPGALHIDWNMGGYLGRGESIRALSSLGHPLVLGFVMMIGLSFYLSIAHSIKSKTLRLAGFGLIFAGLIAPMSRGPWVGTAIMILTFIALGHNKGKRFTLLIIAVIITIPALYFTPGGDKIINLIPFIGETDKFNIDYREKLIDRSILIVKKYPLFGVYDARAEPEMADMVQGEGIIDIVNVYLGVALETGLVGLSLFIGFFYMLALSIFKHMKRIKDKKSQEYLCGKSLLATLAAILFTISTLSNIGVINMVVWSLAGLIVSYIRVTNPARINKTDKFIIEKPAYPTFRLKSNA